MSSVVPLIRSLFDLPAHFPNSVPDSVPEVFPEPGQILMITGPSGSGKSQLLRKLKFKHSEQIRWIEPTDIRLDNDPVIDVVCRQIDPFNPQDQIEQALMLLSRVGLAEAWTYLQRPSELSDGQRWRLILAMMIARSSDHDGVAMIATDEFASLLDRVTAMIVSRSLRKIVRSQPSLRAIIVTGHDDLVPALQPDLLVECDFGEYRVRQPTFSCPRESPTRTTTRSIPESQQ